MTDGLEVTGEVLASPASIVLDQAGRTGCTRSRRCSSRHSAVEGVVVRILTARGARRRRAPRSPVATPSPAQSVATWRHLRRPSRRAVASRVAPACGSNQSWRRPGVTAGLGPRAVARRHRWCGAGALSMCPPDAACQAAYRPGRAAQPTHRPRPRCRGRRSRSRRSSARGVRQAHGLDHDETPNTIDAGPGRAEPTEEQDR